MASYDKMSLMYFLSFATFNKGSQKNFLICFQSLFMYLYIAWMASAFTLVKFRGLLREQDPSYNTCTEDRTNDCTRDLVLTPHVQKTELYSPHNRLAIFWFICFGFILSFSLFFYFFVSYLAHRRNIPFIHRMHGLIHNISA